MSANPVAAGIRHPPFPARLSRAGRVERVVAAARVTLAAFSFLAIWLDPSTPARFAEETYTLLGLYTLYTFGALGATWTARFVSYRWAVITHVIDLGVFSVLMYLTEGPTSPFFTYFVFAVLAATLRWQWRGTLWTALASILLFVAMGAYVSVVLNDPSFELNRFVIRAVYLAVVAFVLGYAGYYQQLVEGELARVAVWSRLISDDLKHLVAGMLPEAGAILRAPHIVMVWEELEEPWVHVSSWDGGGVRTEQHPPGTFGEMVAEPLAHHNFMCADLHEVPNSVLVAAPGGPYEWIGTAMDSALRTQFEFQSVLSWPLRGETFTGRLFAAQKPDMIADDLVLGEIIAALVSSRVDHAYLMERLRHAAAVDERYRLGRDLHDGLLQSLTAIALRLRSISDMLPARADEAQERLRDLQAALEGEQRDVRSFIRELRSVAGSAAGSDVDLWTRITDLCARVERVWPLRVRLRLEGEFRSDASLALQLYRVVHEALINAARHSGGSTVDVVLTCHDDSMVARVADDGRGFPFRGRRSLSELGELNEGPAALRERIERLNGDLIIDSTPRGSTLEITVPLPTLRTQSRTGRSG